MPTTLEAPPSPPDLTPVYRGGGGGGRPPWQLWLALVILAATLFYVGSLAIKAFNWQPVATVVSIAWAIVCSALAYRRFFISDDSRMAWIILWSIVGGVVAETLQVIVSRNYSMGAIWLAFGIVGIGGGFGIGGLLVATLSHATMLLAKLLLRWRAA